MWSERSQKAHGASPLAKEFSGSLFLSFWTYLTTLMSTLLCDDSVWSVGWEGSDVCSHGLCGLGLDTQGGIFQQGR